MSTSFAAPPSAAPLGPGSQPTEEDGGALDYMPMPEGMMTFSRPLMPEPEEIAGVEAAMEALEKVLGALRAFRDGGPTISVDLAHLDAANLRFIDQMLGSGEVSIIAGADAQIQESAMAAIWRVRRVGADGRIAADHMEVGHMPAGLTATAFAGAQERIPPATTAPPVGVHAAPALLTEIDDHLAAGRGTHSINLSLLPHSDEDLAYLSERLGQGPVIVLSRGYGNCRISGTATRNVWWVQYFNSQDALILNSLEVTPMPEVARAAIEDVVDSAERLDEILEIYR